MEDDVSRDTAGPSVGAPAPVDCIATSGRSERTTAGGSGDRHGSAGHGSERRAEDRGTNGERLRLATPDELGNAAARDAELLPDDDVDRSGRRDRATAERAAQLPRDRHRPWIRPVTGPEQTGVGQAGSLVERVTDVAGDGHRATALRERRLARRRPEPPLVVGRGPVLRLHGLALRPEHTSRVGGHAELRVREQGQSLERVVAEPDRSLSRLGDDLRVEGDRGCVVGRVDDDGDLTGDHHRAEVRPRIGRVRDRTVAGLRRDVGFQAWCPRHRAALLRCQVRIRPDAQHDPAVHHFRAAGELFRSFPVGRGLRTEVPVHSSLRREARALRRPELDHAVPETGHRPVVDREHDACVSVPTRDERHRVVVSWPQTALGQPERTTSGRDSVSTDRR